MGHLLSKTSKRVKKRRRKLRKNCFLHGPCMLCFIVHNTSVLDEDQFDCASKLAERYTALTTAEDCAKFLLSPKELAIWEEQGKNLLSSVPAKLIGPQFFRTVSSEYSEMVCKRKCTGVQTCTPCKQPRCAAEEATGNAFRNEPCSEYSCTFPSSSSGSSMAGLQVDMDYSSSTQQCDSETTEPVPQENLIDLKGLEPQLPNINQLPSSILLKIFSNLSLKERCLSASLVCKYWRDLSLDFQFWKQLDLSGRQQVSDDLLDKIASRSRNIMEVNLSDCRNVTDTGVCVLASQSPGLLKYTAYRCKQLSDNSLTALASHCSHLQKIHVGNQDKLTDEGLKELGRRCTELRDIHFGQCYKISDEGMVAVAKGSPKLQKIYMQENKLVTDKSIRAFAEHCPELQYVGFMGCSVTSQGVIHLTCLKNLSSLDLRHITELNNETVMEVVKKCRSLSSLNLCLNWSINDRCVEFIAKEGQSLKELYLVSCKITDYALIAVGRYSTTIETVDVGWCKEITDQGATLIAQSSKSLRYLGLMRCDKVNEETVEQLVQQYPHITFSTVMQDCKRTLERAYQMGWTPNSSTTT
ncbi:F-box/LRR-repeat protein 17 [Latimeria chalumnae]|uniref:F-box/LRR-repeat protein 17 n=1 Tax=Latimeria chalumnae TaxID=7897 RepID=UPI0003C18E52|nr:PREDICTED: F-box/LRR-repeat protein 17 [Latimeria chalumnae]XP_005995767.1 PREDICTED: F-box/LRR-repeat protein 17 [Latimeria chalumnae]|eukprot:XP_005995766.1 PREDICTED: F-box/LRR-repeat protein 17 [Latimeria chalumnae]